MITFDPILQIFYSTKINNDQFISGFGTKQLGDGREVTNIFNFFIKNEIPYQKLVVLEQIHSVNVEYYEKTEGGDQVPARIEDTDGVITNNNLIALTVQTADCMPLIFVDKQTGLIGISHQGWRGSLKKLPQKMIGKMVEYGARKESILVAIGPGIGQCCYDIDDDHYYTFLQELDGYSDKIFQVIKGRKHLNLALLDYLLLSDAGIKKENIDYFPFCTSCDKDRFFSFRRDKKVIKKYLVLF